MKIEVTMAAAGKSEEELKQDLLDKVQEMRDKTEEAKKS